MYITVFTQFPIKRHKLTAMMITEWACDNKLYNVCGKINKIPLPQISDWFVDLLTLSLMAY